MADKKRNRRKIDKEEKQTCTKEEYAVAKFMRFNAPTRDAKFVPVGNYVKCFMASKVVDALMDSKWAKGTTKGDIQFTDRKSVVAFCDRLLSKGLFHRAMKIKSKRKKKEEESATEEEKKKKKKSKKDTESKKDTDKESKKDTDKESKKDEDESKKDKDKEKSDEKEDGKKDDDKKKDDEKKKKEKKLRLDMHEDQRFIDGEDVYVWIYDPVPAKTFIIGLLMVIGAAALCLFPLWPGEMRIGVYYISLVGASFVGFILLLVLLRFVLFCALWILTLGKLHFWLLPNLTEDVGFIDSFRPLYTYKIYKPSDKDAEQEKKKKSKKEKKEKEKESDKEETETGDDLDRDDEQDYEMVQPEDVDFDEEEEESGEEQTEDGGPFDDNDDEESQNDSENKKDK